MNGRTGCLPECSAKGRKVGQLELPAETAHGTFVVPTIVELECIADLTCEIFGSMLPVIRYRREEMDQLLDAVNTTGYALTFGLHNGPKSKP
jgi:RHH-type transcriptional regulator, proline utilization regulon repressor / proline dehydrogenase / delta 1-pyrroline-5-carboxylate dehydrogenase